MNGPDSLTNSIATNTLSIFLQKFSYYSTFNCLTNQTCTPNYCFLCLISYIFYLYSNSNIYIYIYIYISEPVCLFVRVFLPNGESDRHGIQSAYPVHHGKEETELVLIEFPLALPWRLSFQVCLSGFTFIDAFDARADAHLNGQDKPRAI